ncbi:unnamed protein product, partial [Staurois parvus]
LTTSSPNNFTPFLSRPIFSFQCYHTLNNNCAVMQHYTHMNFFCIFFETDKTFFWWYLFTNGIFYFFCYINGK